MYNESLKPTNNLIRPVDLDSSQSTTVNHCIGADSKIIDIKQDTCIDIEIEIDTQDDKVDIQQDVYYNTTEIQTDEYFMNKLITTLEPYSKINKTINNATLVNNVEMMDKLESFNSNIDIRASNSPMTLSKSGSESSFENSEDIDRINYTLNKTKQSLTLLKSPLKPSARASIASNMRFEVTQGFYNDDDEIKTQQSKPKKKPFRNLSLKEIEHSLEIHDRSHRLSNELDIIITYLNGQKNLYINSRKYTNYKLNLLMLPTLLLSSVITIVSPFGCDYEWSNFVLTILNATITLLVSLVTYFKLESRCEIYSHLSSQYDKLQTVLEMANSRLIIMDNERDQDELVSKTMQEFELKTFEIKESNIFFVPEHVKSLFPIISHINIFSFIKRIETHKKNLIYKYRYTHNEMRYILYNADIETYDERCKLRLAYLVDFKTKLRDELIEYKTVYSCMDDAFIQEIKNAEEQKFWFIYRLFGHKTEIEQPDIIKKHIPKL